MAREERKLPEIFAPDAMSDAGAGCSCVVRARMCETASVPYLPQAVDRASSPDAPVAQVAEHGTVGRFEHMYRQDQGPPVKETAHV